MKTSERLQSELLIPPFYSKDQEQLRIDDQHHAVGRKVADLLREPGSLFLTMRTEREVAHHMETDPNKPAPSIHRIIVDMVRLEPHEEPDATSLQRLVARLQRRINALESQVGSTSSPSVDAAPTR
jgi:hypothetical protein